MGCLPRTAIPNAFVSFLYKAYEEILFTFRSESPVFIGIPGGEEYSGTLHLLFTTLHPSVLADLQSTYQSFASVSVSEGEEW